MTDEQMLALWEAINAYAESCGGDTSMRTATLGRQNAVVAIANAVQDLLRPRITDAAESLRQIKECVDRVWSTAARPALRALDCCRALRAENARLMAEHFRLSAAVADAAKTHGVDISELRAWVKKRERVQYRAGSQRQAYGYAKQLLAILDGAT